MQKHQWIKILPLLALAAAITFSPELVVGTIGGGRNIVIRIEDVLLVILGLAWIASFLISGKLKFKKPPLFFPILIWLGISFFGILTNWILGNIEIWRGFSYFLKEIEFFFLYFYVFYHLGNIDSAKFIINFWIILGVTAVIVVLFQYISGENFGSYGPSLPFEEGPFPSGGFFLITFAYLFNILLYYYNRLNIPKIKKFILSFCILSLIIGIISSASRTAILGLALVVLFSLFFYQIKRGGLKPLFISLIIFVIVGGMFFVISGKVGRFSNTNLEATIEAMGVRTEIWQEQLGLIPDNLFNVLFGLGKSIVDESHSQYVRNFIETGIIGSLIFFFLISAILKKSGQFLFRSKDPFLIGLSAGIFISTLAMLLSSIFVEAFMVVRVAEIYWFFIAFAFAILNLDKRVSSDNFRVSTISSKKD